MDEKKPCRECREPISVQAKRCPYCGHIGMTKKTITVGVLVIVGGAFLSATLVGAIIGLPMIMAGIIWLIKRGYESTPADTSTVES